MAKQESLVKIRGKVGDLSFSKHRTRGYEVRMKGGVDKNRILTDPNYQRTRENMAEFGSAASSAKQLRVQVNNLIRGYTDTSVRNRLTSMVHRIQKSDTDNARGERVFQLQHAGLLKGFEFNSNSSLKLLLAQDLPVSYDRGTGLAQVDIPEFNPQIDVLLLQGATHMQVVLAAAQLELTDVPPRPVVVHSGYIPLIGLHPAENLQVNLSVDPDSVVYLMLGIAMYQEVNGMHYPLKNNPYNALTIVHVDVP